MARRRARELDPSSCRENGAITLERYAPKNGIDGIEKKWGEVPTWCGARFGCVGPLGFGWGGRVGGGIAKRGDRRREMAGDVVVE